jgi:hypothetical protein
MTARERSRPCLRDHRRDYKIEDETIDLRRERIVEMPQYISAVLQVRRRDSCAMMAASKT